MLDPVILVVDDEPSVVRLCQRLLEKSGFQVVAATSASQALAILARQPVDLMLADIRMPELNGFQLVALARQHQPDLATVFMTGFGTVEVAITALRQGADALILKPFDNSELLETVRVALKENEQKREAVRLRALRPLFDVTELLVNETDLTRLPNLIVEVVSGQLNCSFTGIYQRNSLGSPFELLATYGQETFPVSRIQEDKPLGPMIAAGTPFFASREIPNGAPLQAFFRDTQLGSILCAPVSHKESQTLLVSTRGLNEPAFQKADLEMYTILARQAGLALENAHLYNQMRVYVQQVEKTQRAMSQAEKMVAAGRLTASIAHEINNPLQSLHNCLHLARRDELSYAKRSKYLDMAQGELDRLMSIVQRMLDFYRPGVRDRKLINVNDLIARVLGLMELELEKAHVIVEKDLASDLPLVMVVASQIQQVFLNLILNSIEAMPEGGKVSIHTNYVRYPNGVVDPVSGIEIILEDTGPGIPDSETGQLFEPLFSTKEHGTGMGLAVCNGIVTAHGGSIHLVKGHTGGACFRIFLPEGDTA